MKTSDRLSELVVVGICGRARSGKSTAANALALLRGCHVIGLADGIREAFASLSGPTGELHKELTAEHNFRRALQTLGTESRDAVNAPGLWVHLALAKIHYLSRIHPAPRTQFVIPDVRYRHEASMLGHAVEGWGGRFGVMRLTRESAGIAESNHSSETEIASVPFQGGYDNDGTIEDLAASACAFFDMVASGAVAHLRGMV